MITPPKFFDASARPDGDLVREVYAHFGLCMYFAQVFETSLIIILTNLERSKHRDLSPEAFDKLYAQNEKHTFGSLMKELDKYKFLPDDLMAEISVLKSTRDHLAHRFFRDHDLDFMTVAGAHVMIDELVERRERFSKLDKQVMTYLGKAYEKSGYDPGKIEKMLEQFQKEMLDEAASRYISTLKD